MKKLLGFAVVVAFIALLLLCNGHIVTESSGEGAQEATYSSVDSLPMLITQVRKCSKLYTAEYRVHKIVTHDDVLRLKGSVLQRQFNFKVPLGDRKIAIPIDVTILVTTTVRSIA